MADKIVFDYVKMDAAVTTIKNLANQYISASTTFQTSIASATDGWEGSSKESFMEFITGPINKYMGTDVPNMVNGIATLLENNAKAMQDADKKVADNMPDSL